MRAIVSAAVLIFISHSAAAQSHRGVEIMEQALACKPDVAAGEKLFKEHCSSCHGERALGDAKSVTPALAGQLPLYVIKQLVDMAEREREVPEMHRVVSRKELARPQGIADVAAYVGQLPPNSAPEVGEGTELALGKRYYQGLCAFCHGEQGGGNEQHATPALRRQHYSCLLSQMRELASMHRYAVDVAIVEALDGLSFSQMQAVADYAARLPEASP
jgi:cytochrome c553